MAQCTVLYPGLLGPAVPLEELDQSEWPAGSDLPGLSLLFRRGQAKAFARQAFEQQILACLGYIIPPDGELPVAALRQQCETRVPGQLWCLDPVHIQLDREMAYLASPDTLGLSETEARALIASINQHFADVLQVRYHQPQQWLGQLPLQVSTYTPTQATLQDVNRMLPRGRDAQRWRKLLNELQMLLHAHPVNEARIQAGKLPVNSVWLWGGGEIKTTTPAFDMVYADKEIAEVAAVCNGIAHQPVPASVEAGAFKNQNTLLILTQQLPSIQQKDVYAWLSSFRRLDQDYVSPLLSLLANDTLTCLTLCTDTMQLNLNRAGMRKWWRRPKKLRASLLSFRDHYGH